MERTVDGHHVTDIDHVLDIRMPDSIQLLLHSLGQPMPIVIMQMHVKRFESAENGKPMRPAATVPTCMPSHRMSAKHSLRCSSLPSPPIDRTECEFLTKSRGLIIDYVF